MQYYKVVVLDMDGTLLNGKNEVSQVNKETIMELKEQGIQFILASGRPYDSIVPYAVELDLDLPIISANGALVKSVTNDEVIYSSILSTKWVKEILNFAKDTTFAVSLYLKDEIFTFDEDMLNLHKSLEGLDAKKIDSFKGNQSVIKILMANHPDKVNETIKQFELRYKNNLYITSSEPYFLEIMNSNASKGIALEQLIKKMSVSPKEVIAIGNNFNDIAMFEVAGFSVAMSNSPLEVQGIADFVTKSNVDDGVAYVLKKVFKKEVLQ
ncbi:HAD family phosphatase [Ralstonia pickettii]|nr:HAD family phosphatase [Ralstonia pickettii]